MKKYDVIIAGAGNAGLACAKTAAESGLRVLLVEKSPVDRLGHPWWDVVEAHIFERTGFSPLPPDCYRSMTMPVFVGPDLKTRVFRKHPSTLPLPL